MINTKEKLKFFVFLLLIFAYIPAKSMAADKIKIGIVNLDRAGKKSKRGKEIVEAMKRRVKKEREVIQKKEARVKELKEELNKHGLIMSEELRRKKESDFRTESRSLERHIRDAEEEIRIRQREASNKIMKELLEIVRKIGKKEDYSFIATREFVVYREKAIDITDKAIKQYNKEYRTKKSLR